MKRPPRALEAKWRAKLARAGFADLEGSDRDGLLSDRGNPPMATEDDVRRLEDRGAYVEWARGILATHSFASERHRRVWSCHAEGLSLRETATALRIGYHDARDAIIAVRAEAEKARLSDHGNEGKEQWRNQRQFRALVRRADPSLLTKLAAVLLRDLLA